MAQDENTDNLMDANVPGQPGQDAAERTPELAHVLFMDLVAYSRLATDDQKDVVEELQKLVRSTAEFQRANAAHRLIGLPAGDGLALVFFQDPMSPVQCALELAEVVQQHSEVQLRMGIHSGLVFRVADINTNLNVTGGGVNIAQRVMDCGDAGHILVSKTVADTLLQLKGWQEHLRDLGSQEVKHSVPVHIFNVCKGHAGNPQVPSKVRAQRKRRIRLRLMVAAGIFAVLGITATGLHWWWTHRGVFDSLAVLPIVNSTGDPSSDYLSDGMTEGLINTLGKLPDLQVISRSAVARYRNKTDVDPQEVWNALRVQAVLTGTVAKKGDHLAVTMELVDARNRKHLWGQTYDRLASEFSAIQEDICHDTSSKLGLRLSPSERRLLAKRYTNNPEAQMLYLRGRFFWNKRSQDGFRMAIDLYNQAIEKDADFALAYTGLADVYTSQSGAVPPKQIFPQAELAAMKAINKDDTLAEAHAALASIKLNYGWDWLQAEKEYQRAIELNPKYASAHSNYGVYLMVMERFDEALNEMKRAQQLDPNSLPIAIAVARPLYLAGKYQEAMAYYRNALEMDPNFLPAHYGLGLIYEQQGKVREAIAEYTYRKGPNDTGPITEQGHALALVGDKASALKALEKLDEMSRHRYVSPCESATIYAGLGDREHMFDRLNACYEDRSWEIIFLKVDPVFKQFRQDPRFVALTKRLRLAA